MSRSTISFLEIFQRFPDQEAARIFMEWKRWPDGPQCPHCQENERIGTHSVAGYHKCLACKEIFTVRTKTVMERSHIPLHKWLYGMYLMVTARKGVSSVQLSKEIGVSQKSAWFMLQRLREACRTPNDPLSGIVEIDEAYFGGFEGNKHESKKLKPVRGTAGKEVVIGMRERKGRVRASHIDKTNYPTIHKAVFSNVRLRSTLHTDDHSSYQGLGDMFYTHKTVKHGAKEFVRGDVHTNGLESVWAVMKRGVYGVYHHVTPKHLQRYVDEFAFRLNQGNCANHTLQRIDAMLSGAVNKRLTYAELTTS